MIIYIIVLVCVFGLAMGSFLNCLAWRLYHEESLWGRSKCPKCHKNLKWYDNLPVFGWLRLKGRCRFCREKISSQYILMELIVGGLFLLVFLININFNLAQIPDLFFYNDFNWTWFWMLLRDWFFLSSLVVIFLMDYKWFIIVDEVSLTAASVMLFANLLIGIPWYNLLIAAGVGAGFFLMQYIVSKGAWVGGGDIRMGLLMGLALGWPNIVVGLLFAYFVGAFWGVALMLAGKKKMHWNILFKKKGPPSDEVIEESALPFGTFLALGSFVAYYWGDKIISWYFNLFF